MLNSRLMAGPNREACSSYMCTWRAATVSRNRIAVLTGEIARRRFVARQQKNPTIADTLTMTVGGVPTLIFSSATKRTIRPSAIAWLRACALGEYIASSVNMGVSFVCEPLHGEILQPELRVVDVGEHDRHVEQRQDR